MSVYKAKEFPEMEFSTQKELFKHLRNNHDRLIKNKKAAFKPTDSVAAIEFTVDQVKQSVEKSQAVEKFDFMRPDMVYPVINTINYLDSHNDVHAMGMWNKSAEEQNGKTLWIVNHNLEIGSEVAYEKDVNIIVKEMTFKDLGYDSSLKTQALIFETPKSAIVNDRIKDRIEKNIPTQHSIRMQYVKVLFAMDSSEKEDEEYKATYDKYINQIANKEKAREQAYFWVVTEAKIASEGSSVIQGSNDITPMLIGKSIEPSKGTQSDEPSADTHKEEARKRVLLNMAKLANK